MAKHRALPDYVYQRELADSSTYVRQDQSTSEEKASTTVECTSMEQEEDAEETEYGESTDEEGSASEKSDENDSGNVMTNETDKSATFLLGRITQYGRAVRFNSCLLF